MILRADDGSQEVLAQVQGCVRQQVAVVVRHQPVAPVAVHEEEAPADPQKRSMGET